MSGALGQDAAVALIVLAALAWLLVRWLRSRGKDAACESCPSGRPVPGVRPAPAPEVLLAIGEPAARPTERDRP